MRIRSSRSWCSNFTKKTLVFPISANFQWQLITWFFFHQHIEMVTLIPRFPLSAKSCAMEVSKTKQSEFKMADETPSWIDLGVASHVNRLLCPFNSSLNENSNGHLYIKIKSLQNSFSPYLYAKFSACFLVPISCTIAKNCWWPSNFSCFSNTSL